VLDWIASTLVTVGFIGARAYQHDPSSGWVVLGVFALEVSVLTAFTGGSFGQLITGIRVMTLQGRPLSLPVAVARTLLICVVVPPLVFKPGSGRGLHEIWTGSAAYKRR
jgi:uncharacterized RDD family membrane protein YckC